MALLQSFGTHPAAFSEAGDQPAHTDEQIYTLSHGRSLRFLETLLQDFAGFSLRGSYLENRLGAAQTIVSFALICFLGVESFVLGRLRLPSLRTAYSPTETTWTVLTRHRAYAAKTGRPLDLALQLFGKRKLTPL